MNGKRGLEESEFIPLRVSSVISGWESRNCASGVLQCIEVVRERSWNIRKDIWGDEADDDDEGSAGGIGSTQVGE
jgi:hypothetical protein